MNKRNLKSKNRIEEFDNTDLFDEPKSKEPEKWTLITAFDKVLSQAKRSGLTEEFWSSVESPINYLTEQLELTRMQVVLVAVLIDTGEPMSWRKFGHFLDVSRLSMMVYSEELEELVVLRQFWW